MRTVKTDMILISVFLVCLMAFFYVGCMRDNDEEDEHNNNDLPFYCGKDMECHDDYLDCVVLCDTWQCVEDQCNLDYLECLSDDGCTQIHLICKDNCGTDQSCMWGCDDDLVDCLAAYCNGDSDCGHVCFDELHGCQTDCGIDIDCNVVCVLEQWICLEGCLP